MLLKIHGHVDHGGDARASRASPSAKTITSTTSPASRPRRTVPVQLAARLRRSHLLFLGYAVDDWSLRVFLRRVWGRDRLAYRSWAVQPVGRGARARALA